MDVQAEYLREVMDEIESALIDPRGLRAHQRRLAFLLSYGSVVLLETYLTKQNVFKSGAKINHLWLKKKKENEKIFISRQITCSIESLQELDDLLDMIFKIETQRNHVAYGKLVSEETLKDVITLFLDLKKKVEHV